MDTKVTSIEEKRKSKLNSKKFSYKYPRIARELTVLSPHNIPDEFRGFYPPDTEELIYAATEEAPFSSYKLLYEVDLSQTLQEFNPLLLYRVMKMMYGDPEIVGAYINRKLTDNGMIHGGVDWSYSLHADQNIITEVRSSNLNTRFKLRFWSSEMPDSDSEKKSIGLIMADCAKTLNENILKNLHIFSHSDEGRLNDGNLKYTFQNLFSQKYRSAEKMLVCAKLIDKKPEPRQLKFDEEPEVSTSGFMYCASALFFIIAFESLIGMLYELVRRAEYKADVYDRVTVKEDHRVYTLIEDGIMFFYGPAKDFMGQKKNDNKPARIPLFMSDIDESIVNKIKETVDTLIACVLSAMDEETQKWTEGWLYKSILNIVQR